MVLDHLITYCGSFHFIYILYYIKCLSGCRAVKFTSKLFGRALSRRIKATVLYATETGRSEMYAKKLGEIFGHAFNAQVFIHKFYTQSNINKKSSLNVTSKSQDKCFVYFFISLYVLNQECILMHHIISGLLHARL